MDPKKIIGGVNFKSLSSKDYIILAVGFLVIIFLAFLFFRYVIDKDNLSTLDDKLEASADKLYSYTVGTVKEVIIPLPKSVGTVCFTNYNNAGDFGVDVSLEPAKLDAFKLKGVFVVEKSPLCVPTSGSLKAKLQLFSKNDLNFVGIYLNSIDPNLFPSYSAPPVSLPVYPIEPTPQPNESIPQPTQPTIPQPTGTLTDLQVVSCESASANNNCDRLSDVGIVTKEQCCFNMALCC